MGLLPKLLLSIGTGFFSIHSRSNMHVLFKALDEVTLGTELIEGSNFCKGSRTCGNEETGFLNSAP